MPPTTGSRRFSSFNVFARFAVHGSLLALGLHEAVMIRGPDDQDRMRVRLVQPYAEPDGRDPPLRRAQIASHLSTARLGASLVPAALWTLDRKARLPRLRAPCTRTAPRRYASQQKAASLT